MLIDFNDIEFTEISAGGMVKRLLIARLDKIHPVVSGNKLFKLWYYLREAKESAINSLLTFGGAYSNHLAATAYACNIAGIASIGIVRGEKPAKLSPTLQNCMQYGMQLQFISRNDYKNIAKEYFREQLQQQYGSFILVPEGGFAAAGARGASLIMDAIQSIQSTHICLGIGTGTTLAGLLMKAAPAQQIIGVPVLKNMLDIPERLFHLTEKKEFTNLHLLDQYHFGGYAKKTAALISFMNQFYQQTGVPTDFVYTAKLMYAVMDQLQKGLFNTESVVVCLHTGGLQGNRSLGEGELIF